MTEQQQGAPGGGGPDGAARPRHPDDARTPQGQAPQGQVPQGQAPPHQAAPQQGGPQVPQGQAPPQGAQQQAPPPQGPPQGQGPGGPGGGAGAPPAGSYAQAHGDGVGTGGHGQQHNQVLDESRAQDLRNRWNGVQAAFVDEPRQAVTDADQLVGEVLDEVSRAFREQRASLEQGWGGQNEPGTEDLRQALFRYREFFDRLLSL